jgi:hypothetical protein
MDLVHRLAYNGAADCRWRLREGAVHSHRRRALS